MTQIQNSALNPVGKAMMLGLPILQTGKTIAIFDANQVPEGSDLYVQPSEGRLKLEVQVANDNAIKWQNALSVQQARNEQLRADLREAQVLLQQVQENGAHPAFLKEINEFLSKE